MEKAERGRRPLLGAGLVLLSGICWASYVVIAKLSVDFGLDVVVLNTLRLTFGAGVMGLFLLALRKFSSTAGMGVIVLVLVLGALDHGLGGILYISSLHYLDASMAYLLVYTYPAMVVILSAVAGREKLSLRKILAVVVTFIGVAMVLEVGAAVHGEAWIGVMLVLIAVLIFSVYLLFCEGLMDRLSSAQLSFLSLAGGGMAMMAVLPIIPAGFERVLEPTGILLVGSIAVVGTALALVFFLMGVRHAGASRASIVSTAEPVFVVLLAWMFLGELLSPIQFLGTAVLMAGVAIVQWDGAPREPGP